MAKKILVPLAHGFEEIELVGVTDVLRRANLEVFVAGIGDNACHKGAHNINICGNIRLCDITHIESFSAIVLPGGLDGMNNLKKDKDILNIIKTFYKANKLVASICASSAVLEEAGILEGHKFTCYPGFEGNRKRENQKVVRDKNIITANGPSSVIDFALEIIMYLEGAELKNQVAKDLLL